MTQGKCGECGSENSKMLTRHTESASTTTKGKYRCRECKNGWWE